jgi:hypothetical protein
VASTVVSNQYFNYGTTGSGSDYWIMDMKTDPADSDALYVALTLRKAYNPKSGLIVRSTDAAATNFALFQNTNLHNVRGIAVKSGGTVFAVRGVDAQSQQCISDFLHFGAVSTGGGTSHSTMYYNGSLAAHRDAGRDGELLLHYDGLPYYSTYRDAYTQWSCRQVASMMFMYLDGFCLAESRFGIFKQYPATGDGGHEGHMTIFDPKCAPFAPRVDESNTTFAIDGNTNALCVALASPGLPAFMDGFLESTITPGTVSLTNSAGHHIPCSDLDYVAGSRQIRYETGADLPDGTYYLTLACGADGIKNCKGAALTNTRTNEFKDSVTLTYTVSNSNPIDITPPAMPTGLRVGL